MDHETNAQQTFETIDENIPHARVHNRWFRVSLAIVGFGIFLGRIAELTYGREFRESDPLIGWLLSPLSFVWLMAFLYMFYVMVRIRLSVFTRVFCWGFFVVAAVWLGKVLILDWVVRMAGSGG